MSARPVPPRRLWWLVAGFGVWCSALVFLYAVHAIGCTFAWPGGALRLALGLVLLAHLIVLGWMWRDQRATARLPVYAPRTVRARLGQRIASPAGRHQFYSVKLRNDVAFPAFKGSGEITSLSQADGYLEIRATESVIDEGTIVEVTLF